MNSIKISLRSRTNRCSLYLKRLIRGQPRWLSLWVEQETWFQAATSNTRRETWSLIRMARKPFKIIKRTWRWTWEAISRWWGWWIRHRTPTYRRRRRISPWTTPSSRQEVVFQRPNRAKEEQLQAKTNQPSSQTPRTTKGEGAVESWCWVQTKYSSSRWWLSSNSSNCPWRWAILALKAQQRQQTMQPTQATHLEGKSNKPSTSKSTNNSCRCTQAATEFWIKANRRSTIRITRRSTTIAGNSSSSFKSSKFSRYNSSSTTTTTMSVASPIPTAVEGLLVKTIIRICSCRPKWRKHRREELHKVTSVRLLRPSACSTRPAYQIIWTLATYSSPILELIRLAKVDLISPISTTWATLPWRTKTF